MAGMQRSVFQISVAAMLGLVACIAVNVWLFRLSILLGIVGLNISKHIVIAYLCQILGVDKRRNAAPASSPCRPSLAAHVPIRHG
jgi:hypothetical protein